MDKKKKISKASGEHSLLGWTAGETRICKNWLTMESELEIVNTSEEIWEQPSFHRHAGGARAQAPAAEEEEEEASGRFELTVDDVTIVTESGTKVLLRDVCARFGPSLTAIVGPSGAGKTTLLSLLACRLKNAEVVDGNVRLGGEQYRLHHLKKVSGYVQQDDLLFPHLTVRETLSYAAMLRLPPVMSMEEKTSRVVEVLHVLGLEHVADVRVGGEEKRGISGGERKRLCVGIELLMRPHVLFLDEPTSGLDAATALSLMDTLHKLAHTARCIVVCTIHQPASRIFQLFDNLIVLYQGQIVYNGRANQVLAFYASAGFPSPGENYNPADFVIDVINPVRPEDAEKTNANARKLLEVGRAKAAAEARTGAMEMETIAVTAAEDNSTPAESPSSGNLTQLLETKKKPSWWRQFSILLVRSFKNSLRARLAIFLQLLQAIVMGVLIGTVFLEIGTDQTSTTKRQPVLFFCVINQGIFGALLAVTSFPLERAIVLRERSAGTYFVSSYFLAKITAETIIQLVYPFVFSCTVYWLVGLQPVASKFFLFVLFMELCSLAAFSLAIMVAAMCGSVAFALSCLAAALEICRLFGGFFVPPVTLAQMPWFSWLNALSYVSYTYVGVSLNELTGLTLTCTVSQLKNGVCPVPNGNFTIEQLGFNAFTIGQCVGVLIAFIIGFRVFAYLALRFRK